MRKSRTTEKVPFLAPDELTAERAREMLNYDPDTGLLTWKVERYRKHPGDVAGCVHTVPGRKRAYRRVSVSIDYKRYLAHRIIWLMMTGKWPDCEIDHIDGNATNNRWNNLREATRTENARNCGLVCSSATGITGVVKGRKGKYRARIMVNRKDIYLGEFNSIDDAVRARKRAAQKYFGEFARN